MPRHSPNALRRLIRSPNRNAEANRPPAIQIDERHTQHFFSAGPGDNARGVASPPKTPPKAGHTNLSTMSKSRGQRTENRGQKKDVPAPRSSKSFSFPEPPSPGGAERDRTDDLLLAKQALSQLSYSPNQRTEIRGQRTANCPLSSDLCPLNLVGQGGFEPPTSRLSSARSNQLSY